MSLKKPPLPAELESVREAARRALGPISPASDTTHADKEFLFNAKRSEAGRSLPPYYLVYFLLVDLLGFKNLGQFEKISWSVPIDYQGKAFLIEHRKFGVGVFVHNLEMDEGAALDIVTHIKKATRVAEPFFDWLADKAVEASSVNVTNNSDALFARFTYFREGYRSKAVEAEARKDEKTITEGETTSGKWTSISRPAFQLHTEAQWLALAAIESFFSWTEHVFIHISILSGRLQTGKDVARLADENWAEKFKYALDLSDSATKGFYDKLIEIRRELRNFVAHGAFGKDGKAFEFHSGAGAVPLLLPHRLDNKRLTMGERLTFDDDAALQIIDAFIQHLWSGPRKPAELYIQQSQLPIILTMASDGTYARAMQSLEEMERFVDHLAGRFDQAANMDW
jgi:hypothetical protein